MPRARGGRTWGTAGGGDHHLNGLWPGQGEVGPDLRAAERDSRPGRGQERHPGWRLREAAPPSEVDIGRAGMWQGWGCMLISKRRIVRVHRRVE